MRGIFAVDENTFFRKATLSICSSLNLETALWRCLKCLQEFIPVTDVHLNIYEPGLGIARSVAFADVMGGKKIGTLTTLPENARQFLAGGGVPDVVIVNRPDLDPITKPMGFSTPDSSLLIMRLILEDNEIGYVILRAQAKGVFNQEHVRLLRQLNEPFAMALSNSLSHEEIVQLKDLLTDDNRYLQQELDLLSKTSEEIVGRDMGLKDVMNKVRHVAPLGSPVLLFGETGTGKEVIANAIHQLSPRRNGPCIKVNCGALPETLIDSELFGHEKGAFTGALSQKRGRFERAHGGTIFLDEIGDLPMTAQGRLLRVLQNKEIERVGGSSPITVDIRTVAATHRDLEGMVRSNHFREDLWFRINVFPIDIPPLRERKEDIPALVHHFLHKKYREMGLTEPPRLEPGALDRLTNYHWPGNVRELENLIERAMIHERELLSFSELAFFNRARKTSMDADSAEGPPSLDEAMSRQIRHVLKLAKGRVNGPGGAAEILKINPNTLRNRMRKLGIPFGRRREA
ncbi:MAG: sigma 54-interacting transcriptional regulator [Deltaproteobacteria bacterium]|nr:sigma 54-interacting transcriptional regulator [Deltaproteobacteria bacterium]